ncbi:MAG: cysteine--tRNA ligase [Candidatus Eisenbacteria bacterium]|nr:cysteine--tRNA ligase [Candidatus Latescibacterota bacterium]MBD3301509.1 cysteine--tRNA ligase [Candidatus Eisenbacteria bacterium]
MDGIDGERGLRLYDTLRGLVVPFEPAGKPVKVYACGITPYDSTHLGHAFTYVMIDVLLRWLRRRGHELRYVQNLTDIDDSILRAARERDEDWRELGLRWTVRYVEDMQILNVLAPDLFPRATEAIPEIVASVERLLADGCAYEREGNVYFSVAAFSGYGRLSKLPREEMAEVSARRGADPNDPRKRDPLDFLLWQRQGEDEPGWSSPWGSGRPGWHIECSTMAGRDLDGSVDLHAGGADLAYPHHESEIAQAECAGGSAPFARHWFHAAMVRHEGEKISKSLGNLVMVRDLLEKVSPDGLRLELLDHHYRSSWQFSADSLARSEDLAGKLRSAVSEHERSDLGTEPWDPEPDRCAFARALDDDLQTPRAVAVLSDLADRMLLASRGGRRLSGAGDLMRDLGGRVLGLRLTQPGPDEEVTRIWVGHRARFT